MLKGRHFSQKLTGLNMNNKKRKKERNQMMDDVLSFEYGIIFHTKRFDMVNLGGK